MTEDDRLERARRTERINRVWKEIFGPQPRAKDNQPRPKPVKERLCRAGCGRTFKLEFPGSPDAISSQTCSECVPLLLAVMTALWPKPRADLLTKSRPKRISRIDEMMLFIRLRKHRAAFEAAWRLGADSAHLREILGVTAP